MLCDNFLCLCSSFTEFYKAVLETIHKVVLETSIKLGKPHAVFPFNSFIIKQV